MKINRLEFNYDIGINGQQLSRKVALDIDEGNNPRNDQIAGLLKLMTDSVRWAKEPEQQPPA